MKCYLLDRGEEHEICTDCAVELAKRRMIRVLKEGLNFQVYDYVPPFTFDDLVAAARGKLH